MPEQNNVSNNDNIYVIPSQDVDNSNFNPIDLKSNPEVQKLADSIDATNLQAITEFGSKPANQISGLADNILNNIKVSKVEDSGKMLKELAGLMKRFDKKELEPETGFFAKLFKSASNLTDKIFAKYQSMGREIEAIYSMINQYKKEINDNNIMLDKLFVENLQYYKELEKHIAAGEIAIEKIEKNDLPYWENKANTSGDQMDLNQLDEIRSTIEIFKQRVYDLKMAQMVSLQTAPQIRMIQKGNYKLVMKIHSAFVVTIPIFKIGLIQAVNLKRQKVIADSMAALDEATNKLLLQNAQNMKQQSVEIAKLGGNSSIKLETVEENWKIIMSGIDETRAIENENAKNRDEGSKRLTQLQEEFKEKLKRS